VAACLDDFGLRVEAVVAGLLKQLADDDRTLDARVLGEGSPTFLENWAIAYRRTIELFDQTIDED
jgi:hypothetical protein